MQLEENVRTSKHGGEQLRAYILTGTIPMGSESYIQYICLLLIVFTGGVLVGFFFLQAEDESEKEKKSFIVVEAEGCLLRVYVMHYCHGMTMEKLTAEPTKPP